MTGLPPGGATQDGSISASLGKEFALETRQSATIGALQIQLDKVTEDSRCPVGSNCVREGDAVVVVVAREAPAAAATLELHTEATRSSEAPYGSYRVKLIKLEPRPVGEQPTPLAKYTATMIVTKTP